MKVAKVKIAKQDGSDEWEEVLKVYSSDVKKEVEEIIKSFNDTLKSGEKRRKFISVVSVSEELKEDKYNLTVCFTEEIHKCDNCLNEIDCCDKCDCVFRDGDDIYCLTNEDKEEHICEVCFREIK